jgi:branched-chain amino acid transport system permease protein
MVGALAGAALALPTMDRYGAFVVALIGTQVIAALSLNVLMGYAGQISLGQAALVGVGAFGAGQLAQWLPYPFPLLVAPLLGALVAVLVGLPSLRIRGLQVAATTLTFGVAANEVLFARPWASDSSTGLAVPRPAFLADDHRYALLVLAVLAGVVLADKRLLRSRLGRSFLAVRDREDTAAAWGVPIGRTKLAAYAVSGLYAGTAGALYGYLLQRVTPESFSVWASLGLVAAAVVGGAGSMAGVALAESVFVGIPELLRPVARYSPLASAVLLAAMPVIRPEGLGWFLDRPVPLPAWRLRRPRTVPLLPETTTAAAAALPRARRPVRQSVPVRTLMKVEGVHLSFGGLKVLTGVDLEVKRHQVVGLIGPNGAGKSTLFNCMSGLLAPQQGHIYYRGQDLLGMPPHQRPVLGVARTFQNVGLCGQQTVRENLLVAQHTLAGGAFAQPRSVLDARGSLALGLLGLGGVAGERVADLPHGQQRLVEVAAALASAPELVLLDEPAAGLSPEESMQLTERLLELRQALDLSIVIVEHHLPVVSRLCDHVYVLNDGQVMSQGTPEQVQGDPRVIATYLGESEVVANVG